MGGCLSACLPLLRPLFPGNSLLPQAPHSSCPPAPADSPSSLLVPAAALAQQYSLFTRSADEEEQHQATFSKGEDLLPDLGADKSFCTSKLGTENSHGTELCGNETELKPYLLQPNIDVKEDPHGNQSPRLDDHEFRSWRKPDVSDPTSHLDSELFAHEYNLPSYRHPPPGPGFHIPQRAGVISESTNQPWKQGDEASNHRPSSLVDYYVPVSNLPYESYPCPLEWRQPPPPPSLPHPPSPLPPQEIPAEDASFRSREIRPPVSLRHRPERKKAMAAYGDTKSSSTTSSKGS